ncbi:Diacetylchitobiose binding protein DasA [Thermoflexales bacterium]|nr:Diacetylchitobiose binding protein DasA [Thermoflexales bacterium]
MEELEFSVFDHGAEPIAILRSLLADFEAKQRVRVRLTVLPFAGAWATTVRMALYEDGPDVSAIGSSWVGDFVRMNALRPYRENEVRALGNAESFLAASWQSATLPDIRLSTAPTVWAMPWLADTRIICYRRDLLAQAGVSAATAFQSPVQLEHVLQGLRDHGLHTPLVFPTRSSRLAVHNLASWVWGAGGDFLDERDGTLLLDRAATLAGMQSYFRLGRYLSESARRCDEAQADELFRTGQAAITFSGHWLLQDRRFDPERRANLGTAPMMGVPFVGGYHLVIWQYSRKVQAALKLVEYLAGRQAPHALYPAFGLPARIEILEQAEALRQPPFDIYAPMLQSGRSFPSGRLWGLIEKHLVDVIPAIWEDVLASPDPDLTTLLDRHITPLAHRLRLTLKA